MSIGCRVGVAVGVTVGLEVTVGVADGSAVGVLLGNSVGATGDARAEAVAVSRGWIATPELLPTQAERSIAGMIKKKRKILARIVDILYR
jgi:hypothetical protein